LAVSQEAASFKCAAAASRAKCAASVPKVAERMLDRNLHSWVSSTDASSTASESTWRDGSWGDCGRSLPELGDVGELTPNSSPAAILSDFSIFFTT
jgi:hypothetical protein